jgi:hypothetical protein
MLQIALGALLIISGVTLAATRTASRGKLSDPHETARGSHPDTLEPRGRGSRLSLKSDLLGVALVIIGSVLLFSGFL